MAINTGNWGKLLFPGLHTVWGDSYNSYPAEYEQLFDSYNSSQAREEDVGSSFFGLVKVKEEGAPTEYDTAQQGFIDRYVNETYSLGFIITKELMEDDLYMTIGNQRAQALGRSMATTKNTVGANVYNRAFNTSFTFGDGKELIATDHPNVKGGTYSNELTTAADLSELSIEDLCIQISKTKDDAGLRIALQPRNLIIPTDLQFDAERILNSPLQNDTANNAINAIRGKMPIAVNHFLTDQDAWFIRTDAPNGMKLFNRVPAQFTQDNDHDTDNAKFKARERYSFGASEKRGIFGTPGA